MLCQGLQTRQPPSSFAVHIPFLPITHDRCPRGRKLHHSIRVSRTFLSQKNGTKDFWRVPEGRSQRAGALRGPDLSGPCDSTGIESRPQPKFPSCHLCSPAQGSGSRPTVEGGSCPWLQIPAPPQSVRVPLCLSQASPAGTELSPAPGTSPSVPPLQGGTSWPADVAAFVFFLPHGAVSIFTAGGGGN